MKNIATWLRLHRGEVRVAIRATVAALLSLLIATLVGLPQPYWAVLASLLVIQATVGASLQSSLDWLVGTIGGAVYGSVVGWLLPHATMATAGVALVVALTPLAFLAAVNGRYRIAPITAVIALIVPRGAEVGAVAFTLERTGEIGLGALIAVAVALVVLPARAHGLMAEATNRVLVTLADLLPRLASATAVARVDDAGMLQVFAEIREKMGRLDAAATEARRERQIRLSEDPDPAPLVLAVVRVRNDVIIVFRATSQPFPEPVGSRITPRIAAIADAASAYLRELAGVFGTRNAPPKPEGVHAALAAYTAEVDAIREAGLSRGLSTDTVERLFSLSFALDQLTENLTLLADQCGLYARPPVQPASSTTAA